MYTPSKPAKARRQFLRLRSSAFVLIAVSLIVLGSFAAACGGGNGAPSIEEYFERFDELRAQFGAGLLEAEAANAEEEGLKLIQANLANTVALFASFADGVSGLDPPDEIKSQHAEVVEALRAYSGALGDYSDDVSNLDSFEELGTLVVAEELDTALARSGEACLVLEQLAADNSTEIDLNCGSGDQ